tara:strand:+ start:34 stop:363 length:330 start_codon:yes stop_codon:yes gene_type:complete
MSKPLSELIKELSPEVNAKASLQAAEMLTEMSLSELRKSQDTTQNSLAHKLDLKQPSIAQYEKRTDTYISTLKNYLGALGMELEITAKLPDGTRVNINQFEPQSPNYDS